MKKKIIGLLTVIFTFPIIMSCTTSNGDSFGYKPSPSSAQDMDSTEAGMLQQPGGVVAEIEDSQGNPSDNSDFTIRE